MTDALPHEDYIQAVLGALFELDAEATHAQTSTPDGDTLDGWIAFTHGAYCEHWPDGVYLGWDQHQGWALCNNGPNRNLHPLDLDTYAHPRAVAHRTLDRLTGSPDGVIEQWSDWPGAVKVQDAVEQWEVNSR
jgi:hypothetical protein